MGTHIAVNTCRDSQTSGVFAVFCDAVMDQLVHGVIIGYDKSAEAESVTENLG